MLKVVDVYIFFTKLSDIAGAENVDPFNNIPGLDGNPIVGNPFFGGDVAGGHGGQAGWGELF